MSTPTAYSTLQRLLHWTMAVLILAMLVIGLLLANDLYLRPTLLAIHRPLGLALALLALLRLAVRWRLGAPPLPPELPRGRAFLARASHGLLYALMIGLPLLGWAQLSAGGMPVTLWPGTVLPPLLGQSVSAHALLHALHQGAAWLLAALVLGHAGAALHHAWVRRDGVWQQMAGGKPD